MAPLWQSLHDESLQARNTSRQSSDTFQAPTIPNPRLYSKGRLRSAEPARVSHLVNEWELDAQTNVAGLQSGPCRNSASSQYVQELGLTGWGSTSSPHSTDASSMMLQRHRIISQPFPWASPAEQPAVTLNNDTEEPASTSGRTTAWQSPKHQSVAPMNFAEHGPYRSCLARPQNPSWRLTASNRTAVQIQSQTFGCDISGCRMSFNNSHSLRAHLEIHEQSHRSQRAARFAYPASVFSMNSTDSGYVSVHLDGTPLSCACTSTPHLNPPTSPFLSDDSLPETCGMPSTSTQWECDEVTTSSDAYLVTGPKNRIVPAEGCVPSTMGEVPAVSRWEETENGWERFLVTGRGACAQVPSTDEATTTRSQCQSTEPSASSSKGLGGPTTGTNISRCSETLPQLSTPALEPQGLSTDPGATCLGLLGNRVASCPENAEECGEDSSATDYEDMDADGDSRPPTPWPEQWYEGGSELGLQQFAAEVIASCLGHHGDAEDTNDDVGTGHCPADNDAEHHRHEHTRVTTTGVSSTTDQTAHGGGRSSGGHRTKRPRSSDDGGSEEDRSPKRRDAGGPPDNDTNPRKFYACPYQKRNPQQSPLCGMPHGSKRDFGWDSVSRVKQHLLESHGLDHHCRNCWKAYKKVQDALSCHETRRCLQRPSPPKHWLSEIQIAQLKAERVTSQSDEAWYRIADLLFDNEQDYNPESFRAEHTPYYEWVNLSRPFPEEPSPYRSPDSMWTPTSDSTNPPGSTPMPGNQNVVPPTDPAEEGEATLAANTDQQARECCDQPGPEVAMTVATGPPEPMVDHPEPYQCANPEAAVAIPAATSAYGCMVPQTMGYFPSAQLLDASTAHEFDRDELGEFFHFESAAPADPSQPHLADLRPAAPDAPSSKALHQFTDTAAMDMESGSPACSCRHVQKCICRLKKRVADLRGENESLRAEKEAMRTALVGLRQTLEDHDELLQIMEEKCMLSDEAMGKLWEYQDRMRGMVKEHR
ncbi:hypothetical protein B0I37DRAFT_235802 [Chaetomium sp. MPI-CAGE-AT-0009]|nr:hypothetical protein B0I37DRAFT_235802 [Chaetomium sp. MPI-CAGE-AT-0009]